MDKLTEIKQAVKSDGYRGRAAVAETGRRVNEAKGAEDAAWRANQEN